MQNNSTYGDYPYSSSRVELDSLEVKSRSKNLRDKHYSLVFKYLEYNVPRVHVA